MVVCLVKRGKRREKLLRSCAGFGVSFGVVLGSFVVALESAAQIPSSATPGRESEEFRKPLKPKAAPEAKISIPEGSGAVIPAGAEKVKFKLSTVVITGMTVYEAKNLNSLFKDKLGKEITLADVYRIADAITTQYREAGYILSRAVVPAQRLQSSGARVEIRVVEGYVNKIIIDEGDKSEASIFAPFLPFADALRAKIRAQLQPILDIRPLQVSVLERYLLLANDLSGVTVSGLVRPSDQPGASEMVVVMSHDVTAGEVGYNNFGSKFTGPNRYNAQLNLQSFFGQGEKISGGYVRATQSDELEYADTSLSIPIGRDGLVFEAKAIRSASPQLGFTLESSDLNTLTREINVGFRYPVIRSRVQNLSVGIQGLYRHVFVKAASVGFQEDRIRNLIADIQYDVADAFGGVNLFKVSFARGMPIMDATDGDDPVSSRPEARPKNYRIFGEMLRLQPLVAGVNFLIGAKWQYTAVPLFASEEFGVGGRDYGRAYDASEITGDRGFAARAELQITPEFAVAIGGSDLELPDEASALRGVELYGFYDIGWTRNLDAVDEGTARSQTSLASAGFGVRYNLNDYLAAELELAYPLTHTQQANLGPNAVRFNGGIKLLF